MIEERLFVPCKEHDIPMVLCVPQAEGSYPCMLLLHGFLSYKEGDGYLFAKCAQALAKAGIASARIDFCSMGENRSSRIHYGTKIMLEETKTIYQFLQKDKRIISDRIGLLGHSFGGRIALLSTGLNPKCIVTLNGALKIQDQEGFKFSKEYVEDIQKNGHTIVKTSDGRYELVFETFLNELDVDLGPAFEYEGNTLVCVGDKDVTVEASLSYQIIDMLKKATLIEIHEADHTFLAKTGNYAKVNELLEQVVAWLNLNL